VIPGLKGRFLHNRWANPGSDGTVLLGPTPATRRYNVRLCAIDIQEIASYSGGGLEIYVLWRSLNSMAHSSITGCPILDLKAPSFWARCRPHAGIRYVCIASISMKSITTVEGVFRIRYCGDPMVRCQIPPQPLDRFHLCGYDIIGLGTSYTPV